MQENLKAAFSSMIIFVFILSAFEVRDQFYLWVKVLLSESVHPVTGFHVVNHMKEQVAYIEE